MGPWYVYMLRCRDGSLYTGCTNDLARRLDVHNAGRGAAYTRSRLPVRLAWFESAVDKGAALRREAALKRLQRAEKLQLLPRRAPKLPAAGKPATRAARPQSAPRRRSSRAG